MRSITKRQRVIQNIMWKVKGQAINTREGDLMVGIIAQAAIDLMDPYYQRSAQVYLSGDICHAWACGIDSTWVTKLFRRAGEL